MEVKQRTANYFQSDDGAEPVKEWLEKLRKKKQFIEYSKIISRIDRAQSGNFGDHRFLGGNFGEMRIDFGPGYRVYFGIDGDEIILLLHGGTKESQQEDISLAEARWKKYLESKRKEDANDNSK